MTTEPTRITEAAEQAVRADHHPVCKWSHYPGASNACVGECEYACACEGEEWPCSTAQLIAELDRLRPSAAVVAAAGVIVREWNGERMGHGAMRDGPFVELSAALVAYGNAVGEPS
jgi:hypothetical protein